MVRVWLIIYRKWLNEIHFRLLYICSHCLWLCDDHFRTIMYLTKFRPKQIFTSITLCHEPLKCNSSVVRFNRTKCGIVVNTSAVKISYTEMSTLELVKITAYDAHTEQHSRCRLLTEFAHICVSSRAIVGWFDVIFTANRYWYVTLEGIDVRFLCHRAKLVYNNLNC